MKAAITRHALDRVPVSLIIDDSCPVINLNYFYIRDWNRHTGETRRWQDLPVVIPQSFTQEFARWCGDNGVKGKYSVIPCPAGLGRIDEGLPLFGQRQLDDWLSMCRKEIVPHFDITPELLTHTFVLDLATMQPRSDRIWEQHDWRSFTRADEVDAYMRRAVEILLNVGLEPEGTTSPGGFGGECLPLYAEIVGQVFAELTDRPFPYFFKRVHTEPPVTTEVWYPDRAAGTAVGEIIACAGDMTGSWTGYGEADPDYYITEDLQGGQLPHIIDGGDPCILVSHWQGFYGLHDRDRRGFRTFKQVVRRLRERDPHGERTAWRRPSTIAHYACARELAEVEVDGSTVTVNLPAAVPELTVKLCGLWPNAGNLRGVRWNGRMLRRASSRRGFASGSYLVEDGRVVVAVDAPQGRSQIELMGDNVAPAGQ